MTKAARLDMPHASPKGLRHGFGMTAVSDGITLNTVQEWLGHAQLTTTAIYADAVGTDEKTSLNACGVECCRLACPKHLQRSISETGGLHGESR